LKGIEEWFQVFIDNFSCQDVIAYCLERLNMSPDQKDNAGYTPLHVACFCGHLEIARILLQYGANHSETALSGIRPLHEAIENGHVEIVRLLISYGADPCLATYSGQLPIAMAEDEDMEDFLREYLKDINDKTEKRTYWYFDGPFKIEG
jgi:ankyrin repeat protein